MDTADRKEADALLTRALELPVESRARFLDDACGDRPALRATLDRLLRAAETDEPLLTVSGAAAHAVAALTGPEAPLPQPGERVGAYRVVGHLGRGGMATVYLAERADGEFEQTVALKLLDATRYSGDAAARFAQERQILARLEHPHIARLIDGGTTAAGQPYVVMEYVDGRPIDRYCDEERLTVAERIALFERVARAVQYAHGRLIVHRDIKPSNILVDQHGHPKLLDFGIAKLLDAGMPHTAPATRDAFHPMTPEYASPEQWRGEPLTTGSDVYQLGFLLYRLLTGQTPYTVDSRDIVRIAQVVCTEDPRPPSRAVADRGDGADAADAAEHISAARSTTTDRLRRQLTGDLDNILLTALARDADRRYPSVTHLRDDLQRYLDGLPVTARQPTLRYRAGKFVRRNRLAVAGAALIVLAILAGVTSTVWQARSAAREAARAEAAFRFLVSLFENADPDVARGEAITARELLDRGKAQLDAEQAIAPDMRAEILAVIGGLYTEVGLFDEALPLLEEAQTEFARYTGDRRALAENTGRLAKVLKEQGRYEEAAAAAQHAVALHRANPDTTPDELSTSLGNLASIRSLQGNFEDAEALYRQVLESDRAHGDTALLAAHLSDFSASRYRAGDYDTARQAGEEALALHRALYGPDHTLIATSLLNLGTVYGDQGEYATAEPLLEEAIEMRRRLLGDEHPHVALAYANLGNLQRAAGRLDAAEAAHEKALAIRQATLGEAHPDVVNSMNSLGVVLYFNARYAEAADLFEQVVPAWQEAYGPRHPNVFSALNNLGAARREAGDFEGAEGVLRRTLELRREAFGESHRQVAQSLNNLALLLAERGASAEAEALMREAIAMWRETMGEAHPDVADGLATLGSFLLDRARCEEAEAALREAIAIRETTMDADAPLLATSRLYLGECLLKLGRANEAERLLTASLPVIAGHWGEAAEITVRAKQAVEMIDR